MKRVIIASTGSKKITGRTWSQFIQNIENQTGIMIDSIYKRKYEQFIEGTKAGETWEIEVTNYSDGTYEAVYDNIYPVDDGELF